MLSKNSLEKNDGFGKGVGGDGDILTEGIVLLCCRGMLYQRLRKYHHSCDKRGQEKPCLTKMMHFSLKQREFGQMEYMSKTAQLGLSMCIAYLRKEIRHGAGGRIEGMTVDEIVKGGEAWGKGILQTLGENGRV